MRSLIISFLLLSFIFISCTENNTSPKVVEPAGSAQYVIANQSDSDIKIVFTKSPQLNSEVDTSSTISNKTSDIIFEDGIIGVNPKPSDSFSKLEFYTDSDFSSPAYVIDQIDDEEWQVVSKNYKESEYGLTVYKLTVSNDQVGN